MNIYRMRVDKLVSYCSGSGMGKEELWERTLEGLYTKCVAEYLDGITIDHQNEGWPLFVCLEKGVKEIEKVL